MAQDLSLRLKRQLIWGWVNALVSKIIFEIIAMVAT